MKTITLQPWQLTALQAGRLKMDFGGNDVKSSLLKPGYYWALWLTAAPGTHEGDQLTPSSHWEVVEVWENFIGDPCEADACEKFGVSVPGVRETQWPENFKWGPRIEEMP